MDAIVTVLGRQSKHRLEREARRCKDGALKTRYLIVLHLAAEVRPMVVAKCLHVSRSTIYEVASHFREHGEAGFVDRREENGDTGCMTWFARFWHDVFGSRCIFSVGGTRSRRGCACRSDRRQPVAAKVPDARPARTFRFPSRAC